MNHHEVIIIGGGAAGMMCAIACKDFGLDVAILEGNDRIGKKLLTTGNGRCNITNKSIQAPFISYHSQNKDFFTKALSSFSVDDTIGFFQGIGLPIVTLENNKMFPMSLQASSVIDIFRMALEDRTIPVYTNHKVSSISKDRSNFIINAKNLNCSFSCNKLVLACGGKSLANTGCDGSGYTLAKTFGHSILTPLPGLVQLKLNYPRLKALSGIKFDGVAEILIEDIVQRQEIGEILFTDYGISGPPILQLSTIASLALHSKKKVSIKVDLLPHMEYHAMVDFLESHFAVFNYRSVSDCLVGIINKKLIPVILKEASIDSIHKAAIELSWEEKHNLYELLKSWTFEVSDTNSFSNAQVTLGGVDTKEVYPHSLESKLSTGLFFCGEILDVNGDCGGFNLQWAWSSAMAVARNCSR